MHTPSTVAVNGGAPRGSRAHLARCSSGAGLRIAVGLLAALAACSLGPRYHRPDVPTPSAWIAPSDEESPQWPSAEWWRGFRSPELDGFIAQAQRANDDLGAAIARVREADAERRIAGAPLLPTVDATGEATRERASVSGTGIMTYSQFSPLLNASYELDFWGKNRAALAAATAAAAASRYDRATIELTVLSSVATSYFQAITFRDRITLAEANLASASQILHGLRLEREVGTATGLDVAQQETAVAALNATLPPLRQQLRQVDDALAILVGSTPEAIDVAKGSLDDLVPPEVQRGIPSQLLARRPDVAEAEAQLIAANANIAVARAAFFPSIVLTANGGYESTALSNLLQPASRIWALSAGLTQPIFEGGALRGQSEYAKARYAELLAGYHKAVISAFANVEDALVELQQTTEQLDRQQQAVNQARKAFDFSQRQLRAGTINVLTLLNTQTALFTAQDALAQVKYARFQASVDLFKALGGGWQQEEQRDPK